MTGLTRDDNQPVYARLYEDLKEQLVKGAIAPGECLTGENQLSRDYGISRPSARKALDLLVAEGLIHKWQGKGTFAGPAAAATGTIGVVHYPSGGGPITGDFYSRVFQSLEKELNRRDSLLLLAGGRASDPRKVDPSDLKGKVDGLIIFGIMDDEYIRALTSTGLPAVLLDYAGEGLGLDSVVVDDDGGACDAVRHLVEMGHRHIGFLGGVQSIPWQGIVPEASSEIRLEACRRVLADAGLPAPYVENGIVCVMEEGYKAMLKLLECDPQPTAVFAFDNAMSLGAIKALEEKGMRVPDDMSLIAFEGDENLIPLFDPPLSVMKADSAETMGCETVRVLFERLADRRSATEQIVIPFIFEPGGSCAPLPEFLTDK